MKSVNLDSWEDDMDDVDTDIENYAAMLESEPEEGGVR
jgi:hypothetical protein